MLFSEPIISCVSVDATSGETARPSDLGLVVARFDRSGPCSCETRCDSIRMPPFAMVAAISAFCSGVSATSRWPMLD